MATALVVSPHRAAEQAAPPPAALRRRPGTRTWAIATLLVWIGLYTLLKGRDTLLLDQAQLTGFHRTLNDFSDSVGSGRNSNPLFLYGFNEIRLVIDTAVSFLQDLISRPSYGRPVPVVGWLGVVALATYVAGAIGRWRVAALTAAGLLLIGLQGLWNESMDTLALTLSAVAVSLMLGIPIGIWAGLSDRVHRVLLPVLDFMQTLPTFVYLAPLTLIFLIGPASATIVTLIYAMPPVVRLTAYGIRAVPEAMAEAATSLGSTRRQTLTKVLLPVAKRSIVVGINQTIMAALSMVTIAALIDAPGLGKVVVKALETLDVGTAFNAGLAIVVLAIVLDRVTTAASQRSEGARTRGPVAGRRRRTGLVAGGVAVLGAVVLSRTYLWAADFPGSVTVSGRPVDIGLGTRIAKAADTASSYAQDHFSVVTIGLKDGVTLHLLNPFESLLTGSPWWLVGAALATLAFLAAGRTGALTTLVCLGLLIATGLWGDAMTTLASTLLATMVVLALGVLLGVWMGRSARADRTVRPVLDAAQTMPAFVYLVPFLALFAPSRFTAIVAAVIFAAPVTIKIVADGIRAVPVETVEAATALGSTTWQTITKVELPMARQALTLAANQGLIYVLSMVVVGGLVGGGALGYDVVAGFSRGQLYGKGLAAGLAIVLLGVMLDRVTQAAARRSAPLPRTT